MTWWASHTNSQEVDFISSSICGFLEFSSDLILGKESYQVNSVNVLCFVLFLLCSTQAEWGDAHTHSGLGILKEKKSSEEIPDTI